MDRLNALEQSIWVEAELSQLFNALAVASYQMPDAQKLWERLAKAEASHVLLLEFEKWRMVREELDTALIRYDDQSLLRQMKRFDQLRTDIVRPPELVPALKIALKAEESALEFHNERIFIEDFGVSDTVVQAIVEMEERHRETLEHLVSAADPAADLKKIDLTCLDEILAE